MKGVIYTRVSSDEQVAGTSLGSQEELCRRYCDQKGISVAAVFREEGESAKDLSLQNRSQFRAALEQCRRQGDIDAFVVFRVDRFARNTEDHFTVRRVLMSYGTALHSVTEPIGNKPAEKFIETVLAGAAEYDNAVRKQRCTDGMLSRMRQGIWPFRAPKGYKCAHHRMKGEKKTVPDEPNPVLFPIIQRGLKAFASGEIASQTALAQQLNNWGFASAYGRRATPQTVDRILGKHLPFYAGILVNPWSREEYHGLHEPMISAAEREMIVIRRTGGRAQATAIRSQYNPAFPLRRLLRCQQCDRYLTGAFSRGNGGRYGYYYCVGDACPLKHKILASGHVHAKFGEFLRRMRPRALSRTEFDSRFRAFIGSRMKSHDKERESRTRRRELLIDRRARVFEMREDGAYDRDTFRDRLKAVDDELREIDAAAGEAPCIESVDLHELTAIATELLGNLAEVWTELAAVSRSRFERLLFPGGLQCDPAGEFRTRKTGLIYKLLGLSDADDSPEVKFEGVSSNQLYQYCTDLVSFYQDYKGHYPNDAASDAARKFLHVLETGGRSANLPPKTRRRAA